MRVEINPSKMNIDWILFVSIIPLLLAGLITIRPFISPDASTGGETSYFFYRQLIWIGLGFLVFFIFSFIDWRFLKSSGILFLLFILAVLALAFLFLFGEKVRGSAGWFDFVLFSVDPADPMKLLLILILSKYFSRRHIDIANFRHILVSGFYAAVPALLIFLQPDFGSAIVIVAIWLGIVTVSGINKKHLLFVILAMILAFAVCWLFVLKPYQKDRILTFLNPAEDPRGAGYNALQSMIAIGSGEIWGKGIGYGTQSRLQFLPEHQTDFIFAAFAEEWGFIGVIIILLCFGVLIWRILRNAYWGHTNFERFFGIGLAIFLMVHLILHVGMNIGLLPITGLNLTFLSYGGSHMVTAFAGLGLLMGMRQYSQKLQHNDPVVAFLGA
jgi:rod shape determining protein RodA